MNGRIFSYTCDMYEAEKNSFNKLALTVLLARYLKCSIEEARKKIEIELSYRHR